MTVLPTRHFGVYAQIVDGDSQLLVRKTRGPYAGLLDLPGGRPEPAESWRNTLRRELHEELGIDQFEVGEFSKISVRVSWDSSGTPLDFYHDGAIADVIVPKEQLREPITSDDTAGWVWKDMRSVSRGELSALAEAARSRR